MRYIRTAVGIAALGAAMLGGSAAATESVCVNRPATDPVYRGCTHVDPDRGCVGGGGVVLDTVRYSIWCP